MIINIYVPCYKILYFSKRTKDLNTELEQSIQRLILIKVATCWKTLLLLKQCRLKKRGKGVEIICRICKIIVLNAIDAKLQKLRKARVKVNKIMLSWFLNIITQY